MHPARRHPSWITSSKVLACFVVLVGSACSKDNTVDASTRCGDNSLDCIPCAQDEYRCDGVVLKKCQADGQGFDAVMSCETAKLCVNGLENKACAAPACSAADRSCNGPVMKICAEGRDKYDETPCSSEAACTAGLKDGKCAAGECETPADCTAAETECRKNTCTAGMCGVSNLPPGTIITAQEAGDCKRAICDGVGTITTEPLPTDWADDGNACTKNDCDGSTPKTTWEPAGTPCNVTGKCDGAGKCLGCLAGDKKCNGNTAQTCQADGTWDVGIACSGQACVSGECTGECEPGAKRCAGAIPQSCTSSGAWQGTQPCPDSACVNGDCVGACAPGSTKCIGNDLLTCDSNGAWPAAGVACVNQACVGTQCTGNCVPGDKRCTGRTAQSCDASGAWVTDQVCGDLQNCAVGGTSSCVPIPSCNGPVSLCGLNADQNCCTSATIWTGSFQMGRSMAGTDAFAMGAADELPEHDAYVSEFRLDLYEVTVGRFYRFVADYPGTRPKPGDGANPSVSDSGWKAEWDSHLAIDMASLKAGLKCDSKFATWADPPTVAAMRKPINCVTWYEALAFCAWDGGWLPTEAEWEKAAANGNDNRIYPWQSGKPVDNLVNFNCMGDAVSGCTGADLLYPGSKPAGVAQAGMFDLAGNVNEWVFDSYSSTWYSQGLCNNCANTADSVARVYRGGAFNDTDSSAVRSARRASADPASRSYTMGFRCARHP